MPETPAIYSYFDFRKFLQDAYQVRKKQRGGFSYRRLATMAGFSSAGYFSKVLGGTCNVSEGAALRLAEAFALGEHESEYFLQLVRYGQASGHAEKRLHFERLLQMRRGGATTLEHEQYELFSHWYLVAIREAVEFLEFKDDYEALGKALWPPISAEEAQQAVDILSRLGLIHQESSGFWKRVDVILTTGEQWRSFAIAEFQLRMMELAHDSMDTTPRPLRDYSTLTLSVSGESVERIRVILKEARQSILEVARADMQTDRVMQLNMQLFPLTRVESLQ